jgi:hypothetical protein
MNDSPGTVKIHRFPHNLDDSRPLDDDDDDDDQYYEFIENPNNILFESTNSKSITNMK